MANTSSFPASLDLLVSAGDSVIETQLIADAVNNMQVAMGTTGKAAGNVARAAVTVSAASLAAGWQNTLGYEVKLSAPVATAGTCAIAIGTTSACSTVLETARTIAASGGPNILVDVPAGWFVKLTPTTSVVATATAY